MGTREIAPPNTVVLRKPNRHIVRFPLSCRRLPPAPRASHYRAVHLGVEQKKSGMHTGHAARYADPLFTIQIGE